jgi:hypothetical protein
MKNFDNEDLIYQCRRMMEIKNREDQEDQEDHPIKPRGPTLRMSEESSNS